MDSEVLRDEDFARIEMIVDERRRQVEMDPVNTYIRDLSLRLAPQQTQLIQATHDMGYAVYIQSSEPEEMQLCANLLRAMDCRKVIEIGCLTGYSALTLALALPDDGHLVACDITNEYVQIGQKYWKQADVAHKIDLRIAPAAETLAELLRAGEAGTYDFVYIDADKNNYDVYYEMALKLVRPRGIIAISNTYYYGMLREPRFQDTWTVALRNLNAKLKYDDRIDMSMLRLGDGLTLAIKR